MCPPPAVISCRWTASPAFTSTIAPIASRLAPACRRRSDSQLPIGAGDPAVPAPTLRQTRTGSPRFTSTRSGSPSRLRSASDAPLARAKFRIPADSAPSTNDPSGWPRSRLLGSRLAWSGIALTLPLDTNRSMNPSLLTSPNSGCQAVEGSASPPVNGCAAATPRRSAMSRYMGWSGPDSSVWSLLSPWLVRYTSGSPSPVRSWLAMPMPQTCMLTQPSASVYSRGAAPGSMCHSCSDPPT